MHAPRWLIFLAMAPLVAASPVKTPAQMIPVAADGAIEQLKPGGYLWAPQIAPNGPVIIIVSLATQRAYAYRNGVPIGVSTISSGAPGHETPTGVFIILQKAVTHHSNRYSNAPMPFMQRLTWSGIAMHAGKLPGYPASHGCIRLPPEFAKKLYAITKTGLTVVITNRLLAPEIVASPGLLTQQDSSGPTSDASFAWQPAKSPKGPVTILVSGRDKRIVVLRNGVEIGSSAVNIDGSVTATEAFTLNSVDSAGAHWMRLPLPGRSETSASEMTAAEHARLHFPDALRSKILSIIGPGTTLLITRDTLKSAGTGTGLTVLAAGTK